MGVKMPALLVGWDLIVRSRNESLRDEACRERSVRAARLSLGRLVRVQRIAASRPGAGMVGGTN